MKLAVPAYFSPGPIWTRMLAKPGSLGIAVYNPASGPGSTASTSYQNQILAAQAAGVPTIGYTAMGYLNKSIADMKAEVDRHYLFYNPDGILFDQCDNSGSAISIDRCRQMHEYVKSKSQAKARKVVLNTGTLCPEAYVWHCDVLLCSESTAANYRLRAPSPWEKYYPEKIWHLIHACPAVDMPSIMALAMARGAGNVYITNDALPNPWDSLSDSYEAQADIANPPPVVPAKPLMSWPVTVDGAAKTADLIVR